MSTTLKSHLHVQELEARSLLSAGVEPSDPLVATGTDAHDVITITRLDEHRVEVTVKSFRDSQWTQPTGDPVLRQELQTAVDQLVFGIRTLEYPGHSTIARVTETIQIESGAGMDRIDVVDMLGQPYFVSDTYRNDPALAAEIGVLLVPWWDESGGHWAYAHDVWTAELRPFYAGTLIEGVDMAAGAVVGVKFMNSYERWEDPIWLEPTPDINDGAEFAEVVDTPETDHPAIAWEGVDSSGLEFPGAGDGATYSDWLDDSAAGLEMWAGFTDDSLIDAGEEDIGYGDAGSDWESDDQMDDMMMTDLEIE